MFGGAATVWKGTGFECSTNNEVVIFHSTNSTSQRTHTCNDGAITVRIITAGNDSYTSQLTVQVSNEINGTTVVCAHDSGEDSTEIGSALLNTTTGIACLLPVYREKSNYYYYIHSSISSTD